MDELWPTDFVWKERLAEPKTWGKPGLVMFFNLECAGCISRAIPLVKRINKEHKANLLILLIHTSFGHKHYGRAEVEPTLLHFAESFARLPFPVALDLEGLIAENYQIAGAPHWLVFNKQGELIKSLFGSQDNAQNRLEYTLSELLS